MAATRPSLVFWTHVSHPVPDQRHFPRQTPNNPTSPSVDSGLPFPSIGTQAVVKTTSDIASMIRRFEQGKRRLPNLDGRRPARNSAPGSGCDGPYLRQKPVGRSPCRPLCPRGRNRRWP